ncbi:MAG TPA: hypothetical protein PLR60_03140 [Syntrophorhabdaceae bacterium]|nr:hypothetical protein [Syntrophorhabdaceae bacterium]
MNYDEMSNEELQRLLLKRLLGPELGEVHEGNRQTVIAILKIGEDEEAEDEDKGR